jgi:hypothetical protein
MSMILAPTDETAVASNPGADLEHRPENSAIQEDTTKEDRMVVPVGPPVEESTTLPSHLDPAVYRLRMLLLIVYRF